MHSNLKDIVKQAIDKDLFFLYYQPIKHKNSSYMYECLARIKGYEYFSPASFIPIVKELDFYTNFSKIIIEKSFKELSDTDGMFSINLDVLDLKNTRTVEFLIAKINEYNIGNRLIVEVLENNLECNYEDLLSVLNSIRNFGVKFAMDDFGSGYCDYLRLLVIKPDFIKIPKSMVLNIANDSRLEIIINSVVKMANELNIEIVVEYIANKEIYDILKNKNIDYFQGFYIGKPDKGFIK